MLAVHNKNVFVAIIIFCRDKNKIAAASKILLLYKHFFPYTNIRFKFVLGYFKLVSHFLTDLVEFVGTSPADSGRMFR